MLKGTLMKTVCESPQGDKISFDNIMYKHTVPAVIVMGEYFVGNHVKKCTKQAVALI